MLYVYAPGYECRQRRAIQNGKKEGYDGLYQRVGVKEGENGIYKMVKSREK
jgi:hypothetical protein